MPDFYTIPSNFSSTLAPGRLLKVEAVTDLTNYTVPSSLTMSRILYTTADLNGTILPASAYILWPYAPPSSTGYPMVAWAHGTSGLLRACAPSSYRSLQYHFMAPYLLALQGMAVVAPDYAGLGFDHLPDGTPIRHPWLVGPAQAADLANAILAARAAFPAQLPANGSLVTMGHSQGGQASWAFAERQVSKPIAGYKGAVAIAPVTRIIAHLEAGIANASSPAGQFILSAQPKLIAAVTALFPAYNNSGMSPAAYNLWTNVLEPVSGCLPTDSLVFSGLTSDKLARPGWEKDPETLAFAKLSETGRRKFKGPLLVLAGEGDVIVTHDELEQAVKDTCAMDAAQNWNESLEMVSFSAMNHFPVIQASQFKWLEWIKARLAGEEVSKGCRNSVVNGFRTEDTFQTGTPNFLVEWASQQDMWKYQL